MGQQQLILLALAVVIVGAAIVVGIRAFSENSIKSNADAMTQDAVRVVNDAQAWKQKPAPFGGQAAVATAGEVADTTDFTGATFARLGYKEIAANTYTNLNGTFTLPPPTGTGAGLLIIGVNNQFNNNVQVHVCGLSDLNILGTIVTLGGQDIGVTPDACAIGGAGP